MKFSLNQYIKSSKSYPCIFNVARTIDFLKFWEMESLCENNLPCAILRLRERMCKSYFINMFLAQIDALSYAQRVFPSYRFLLPDVLMDDWLAIVDPHQEYKRDHALHQPQTASIAAELLGLLGKPALKINTYDLLTHCVNALLNSDILWPYLIGLYPPIDTYNSSIKQTLAKDIVSQATIMAAMFHDIGYPWQCLKKMSNGLHTVDNKDIKTTQMSIINVIDVVKGRLLEYPFYGYDKALKSYATAIDAEGADDLVQKSMQDTHGFPGAIAFTMLQDSVRKSGVQYDLNSAIVRFITDWAAVGIMMHDMSGLYRNKDGEVINPQLRLSFDKDPLSCIIALADMLEEYGRPSAGFKQGNDITNITYADSCQCSEMVVVGNTIKVTYHYKTKIDLLKNIYYRQKEVNNYLNPNDGFVDLSSIGITQYSCECV